MEKNKRKKEIYFLRVDFSWSVSHFTDLEHVFPDYSKQNYGMIFPE